MQLATIGREGRDQSLCPPRISRSPGSSTSGCFHLRTQRAGMADPASANGAPTGTNKPVKQPPVRTHVVSPSIPPLEVPPHFLQSKRFKAAKRRRGADQADRERRLQCQHPGCTASYARIEHLDRHVKTHDPSHSYRCDEVRSPSTPSPPRQDSACADFVSAPHQCGKSFART